MTVDNFGNSFIILSMLTFLKFLICNVWPVVCGIGTLYLFASAIIEGVKKIREDEKKRLDENSERV